MQARQAGLRLRRLFNRRTTGWAPRDYEDVLRPIAGPLFDGRIACRTIHLSGTACQRAATEPLVLYGGEGREHALLRQAAALWMRECGAANVRQEARCWVGRADVFSESAGWIVECGATPMAKLVASVMSLSARRFTLIPYQRLRWSDGSARRLVALDFAWDLSIAAEAEAGARQAAAAARRDHAPASARPWVEKILSAPSSPTAEQGA